MDSRSDVGRLLSFVVLYAFGKNMNSTMLTILALVVSPLLQILTEALKTGTPVKLVMFVTLIVVLSTIVWKIKLRLTQNVETKRFLDKPITPLFVARQFGVSYLFGVILSNMSTGLGVAGSVILSINQSLAEIGIALAEKRQVDDLIFIFLVNIFGYISGYLTSTWPMYTFLHNLPHSAAFVILLVVAAIALPGSNQNSLL